MTVRTRFAPSPTGMLHIGGVRTALYAWLHAHHHGGKFLLRIEDTDRERSTDEATQVILDGLAWLGISSDSEPVFQSDRVDYHVRAVDTLLDAGKAYRCYCSRETLDAMRSAQREAGKKPMYDGRCRHLKTHPKDQPFVVRFCSPDEGETCVHDQVLGDVVFQNCELDDLIIMRSDGSPTYNLAVVVDDADMSITHVIRGSDHLNNTPRQIQLYQALGLPVPSFAHIPLIHGADGAKMSKRHGAVAVTDYKEAGYLADALVNYLVRLGWSHGDEEIFSRETLIDLFDIADVGKAAARFDQQKLDWLNAHYLRGSSVERLYPLVRERLEAEGVNITDGVDLNAVIPLLQERSKSLHALAGGAHLFYAAPQTYDAKAVKKNFKEGTLPLLTVFITHLEHLACWDADAIHVALAQVCEAEGVKLGKLAQPIRILIAGVPVSPPIDQTLALLGKRESLERIRQGVAAMKVTNI